MVNSNQHNDDDLSEDTHPNSKKPDGESPEVSEQSAAVCSNLDTAVLREIEKRVVEQVVNGENFPVQEFGETNSMAEAEQVETAGRDELSVDTAIVPIVDVTVVRELSPDNNVSLLQCC
jgi:hypothetical protein